MLVNFISPVMIIALLFSPAGGIQGQEIKSEQKAALIEELLTLMKFEEKIEKMREELKKTPSQKNEEIIEMLWESYAQNSEFEKLDAKQREALKKHIEESSVRIAARFNKEMELQKQKAGISDTRQLIYTAYSRLTENELKYMIAFFGSPQGKKLTDTGLGKPTPPPTQTEMKKILTFIGSPAYKKSVEAAIQVTGELIERVKKELKPKQEVAREIADEELKLFLQKQK
jgi:hypothetical protein